MRKKLHDYKYQLLLGDFILLVTVWGVFIKGGLNWDSLQHQVDPMTSISAMYICGRYVGAGMAELLYRIWGFNAVLHPNVVFCYFMLMVIGAAWIIQITFLVFLNDSNSSRGRKVGFWMITLLPIVNVFFSEHFYYLESMHFFGLGLLCGVGAAFAWTRKNYLLAVLLMAFTPMFYQSWSVYTSMILATWLYLEAKGKLSWKLFCKELLAVALPLAFSAINVASIEWFVRLGIFETAEKTVTLNLLEQLSVVSKKAIALYVTGAGLVPIPYLVGIVIFISLLVILVHWGIKKAWNQLATSIILIVFLVLAPYLIPLSDPGAPLGPRLMTPFYCGQAMLMLTALMLVDSHIFKKVLVLLSIGYICIQVFSIQKIAENRRLSNDMDRKYAHAIMDKIKTYEDQSGNVVTKIGTMHDLNSPQTYDEIQYKSEQLNESTYRTGTKVLMFVMTMNDGWNRHWEYVDVPETILELFDGKDWDSFNLDEQVIIDRDTVYICVF